MRVEIGEPVERRAPIMLAAPAPFLLDLEQIGILPDQMMARHHAAGEEMLRDPVLAVGAIEQIGAGAMGEDVHEEAPVRLQPRPRRASAIRASSSCARTSRPTRCGRTALAASNTFMSAVIDARDWSGRALAASRLDVLRAANANWTPRRCRACGNCRAIHSDSEPQPQPSSRIDCPSARSACSTVWRSASSSASCSVEAASL